VKIRCDFIEHFCIEECKKPQTRCPTCTFRMVVDGSMAVDAEGISMEGAVSRVLSNRDSAYPKTWHVTDKTSKLFTGRER